jgi:hypothetical protein
MRAGGRCRPPQSHAQGRSHYSHWLTTTSGVFSDPSCCCAARDHVISLPFTARRLQVISDQRTRPAGANASTPFSCGMLTASQIVMSSAGGQLISRGGRVCGRRGEHSSLQLVSLAVSPSCSRRKTPSSKEQWLRAGALPNDALMHGPPTAWKNTFAVQ